MPTTESWIRHARSATLAVALVGALLSPSSASDDAAAAATLSVWVTVDAGESLPGAVVDLECESGAFSATTNAQGEARLDGLPPGDVSFTVGREGHTKVEYPQLILRAGETTTIEVNLYEYPEYRGPTGLMSTCRFAAYQWPPPLTRCQEDSVASIRWNRWLLERAGERPLEALAADPELEAYRLSLLEIPQRPVVIRLWRTAGRSASITTRALDGRGGYQLGELELSSDRPVTADQLRELRGLVDEIGFWLLPPQVVDVDEYGRGRTCATGRYWVLEAVQHGRGHAVVRVCPDKDWPTWPMVELMLRLSGVEIRRR
jgi:hypothetical protein